MLKYEYKNATVYITKPTEKHIANIRKATEAFLKRAIKEGVQIDDRKNNRRTRRINTNARERN